MARRPTSLREAWDIANPFLMGGDDHPRVGPVASWETGGGYEPDPEELTVHPDVVGQDWSLPTDEDLTGPETQLVPPDIIMDRPWESSDETVPDSPEGFEEDDDESSWQKNWDKWRRSPEAMEETTSLENGNSAVSVVKMTSLQLRRLLREAVSLDIGSVDAQLRHLQKDLSLASGQVSDPVARQYVLRSLRSVEAIRRSLKLMSRDRD